MNFIGIIIEIIHFAHEVLKMRYCCLSGWMLLIVLAIDVYVCRSMKDYDTAMKEMETQKPKKRTGGLWLTLGLLMISMGVAGIVFGNMGVQRLNMFEVNEAVHEPHLVLDFSRYGRILKGMMAGNVAALLGYGAAMVVIALAKKKLRAVQLKSWENRWENCLNTDKSWYDLQRLLVVLVPTLSALLLSDAFAAHLTGVADIGERMYAYGVSSTYNPVYTHTLSIFILNYVCTLELMMYWRQLSYIPRSHESKVRMALMTLPGVFLVNYILVRAFFSTVALAIPLMVALAVLVVIGSPLMALDKEKETETKENEEYSVGYVWERLKECRNRGDYRGVSSWAGYLSYDEKKELENTYRKSGESHFWHTVFTEKEDD